MCVWGVLCIHYSYMNVFVKLFIPVVTRLFLIFERKVDFLPSIRSPTYLQALQYNCSLLAKAVREQGFMVVIIDRKLMTCLVPFNKWQ